VKRSIRISHDKNITSDFKKLTFGFIFISIGAFGEEIPSASSITPLP
jgi:hypothetical protein